MSRLRITACVLAMLAGASWVSSCGDGATEPSAPIPDPPRPTTVTVTPSTAQLTAWGATEQLTAQVRDQSGQVMAGATVTWASSATAVATVTSAGLVTAASNGTATITAAAGSVSGTATVTVAQEAAAVAVSPPAGTVVAGDTLRLAAEVTDANGHAVQGAEVSWTSTDTAVAMVDPSGLVTGVGGGEVEITATSGMVADSVAVTVVSPLSVSFAEDSLRILEGEAAAIGIQYRVHDLGAPVAIQVSVREGDADAADYELSETRFEITGGSSVEGTFDLMVVARADHAFAEGEESIWLELSVPDVIAAEVGAPLPVAIGDAAVSPTPGVSLTATRPEHVAAIQSLSYIQAQDRLRTTLTSEWLPESRGVSMRWIGPYGERWEWQGPDHPYYEHAERARPHPAQPAFHVEAWNVESAGSAVIHVMDVTWPVGTALALTFGGEAGVICDAEGCSMSVARAASRVTATLPGVKDWTSPSTTRNLWTAVYNLEGSGGWHPSVWPPGDTLVFHVSSKDWPEDAAITPEGVVDLMNQLLGEWSAIPSADNLWRVEGPSEGLVLGCDGKNVIGFDSGPGSHGGSTVACRRTMRSEGKWWLLEKDIAVHEAMTSIPRSAWDDSPAGRISWGDQGMHPLGHLLGLGHSASFPVARSCLGPNSNRSTFEGSWNNCSAVNGDHAYWRAVSGAWGVDPIMSYGISGLFAWNEEGTTLRLDDKVGASLLRPKPGWLASTGTIAGSVRTDDGRPAPHIHVWAVQPNADGVVDGVGAFADRNGDFQIRGLPPGDWILVAHPDLDWLANPWFFYEGQGDLVDEMLLFPVRAEAGQVTGGIEIVMGRGRTGDP